MGRSKESSASEAMARRPMVDTGPLPGPASNGDSGHNDSKMLLLSKSPVDAWQSEGHEQVAPSSPLAVRRNAFRQSLTIATPNRANGMLPSGSGQELMSGKTISDPSHYGSEGSLTKGAGMRSLSKGSLGRSPPLSPVEVMSAKDRRRVWRADVSNFSGLISPGLANRAGPSWKPHGQDPPLSFAGNSSMGFSRGQPPSPMLSPVRRESMNSRMARSSSTPINSNRLAHRRPEGGIRLPPMMEASTNSDRRPSVDAWASQTLQSLSRGVKKSRQNTPSTSPRADDGVADVRKANSSSQPEGAAPRSSLLSNASCAKTAFTPPEAPVTAVRQIKGAPTPQEAMDCLQNGLFSEGVVGRLAKAFVRWGCGEEDMDRELLEQVLIHLNYFVIDEDLVTTLADKVTEMSSFDKQELATFLEFYAAREKDMLENAFKTEARAGSLPVDEIANVLRELKIVILGSTLDDLLCQLGLAGKAEVTCDEMFRIVSGYRTCEGFTGREVTHLQEIFSKEAEDDKLGTSDLPDALLEFYGVHCVKHLRELVESADKVLGDGESLAPIYLHEFLVWARRLRQSQLSELYGSFDNVDADSDGAISFMELIAMVKLEGFTLTKSEALLFLPAAGLLGKESKTFSFDDAVAYLYACRKSEGFNQQDLDELLAAYSRFDVENEGEITTLQVLDLLRFLGYQVTVDTVEQYAKQVDFNENGTMDVNEYLRLMRLHCEANGELAQHTFDRLSAGSDGLPGTSMQEALQVCKVIPKGMESVFDDICGEVADSIDDVSFVEFSVLVGKCRREVKRLQRERANFTDDEVAVLQETFKYYDVLGQGVLSKEPFFSLFCRCGVSMNTAGARTDAMKMLDTARKAALETERSVDEIGEFGSFTATFWVYVQACRLIVRVNEAKKVQCLEEARKATAFSASEIEEFQQIFRQKLKSRFERPVEAAEVQAPAKMGRRRSVGDVLSSGTTQLVVVGGGATGHPASMAVASENVGGEPELSLESIVGVNNSNDKLDFEALKKILGQLQLKLSASNTWNLQTKVEELTGDREGALDLASFLHLMRWMLDTNFASLKERIAGLPAKKNGSGPSRAASKKGEESRPAAEVERPATMQPPPRARRGSV